MDPTFLNLARNNRIPRVMGLEMAPEIPYSYAKDYTYIEVPLWKMVDSEGELTDKASRNQYIELVSAASLKLSYEAKCLAVPNPVLFKYGIVPSMILLDGKERALVTVPITLRKDLVVSKLEYLVRIYLFS